MLEDIQIVLTRVGKAKITGVTQKGYAWIKENMTKESPIVVDADAVPELEKILEKDGLTVLSR